MNNEKKRGLSPVIASVLLILLAVILAVIVFIWAKSFIGESITKGERKIDFSCEEVSFRGEAYGGQIHIENTGTIPLYGIEILKKNLFREAIQTEILEQNVITGESASVDAPSLNDGDEIIVVPVLLGEGEDYKKAYVCDKDYGIEVIVEP